MKSLDKAPRVLEGGERPEMRPFMVLRFFGDGSYTWHIDDRERPLRQDAINNLVATGNIALHALNTWAVAKTLQVLDAKRDLVDAIMNEPIGKDEVIQ